MSVRLTWLGVAGFHIRTDTHAILIDPYFTRVPFHKLWVGRIEPDVEAVQPGRFRANAVFVSHAHIDHLLDVPVIARDQGIPVYGSANTCRLLDTLQLPGGQIHQVEVDQAIQIGDIQVTVLPAAHILTPGFRPGRLPEKLKPPLKARQYVMDVDYCFQIQAGGLTLLTDPGKPLEKPVEVDTLLLFPFHPPKLLAGILETTRPRRVIPSHWDDFLRPIDRPLKPMILPPRREWPPIGRANLEKFTRRIKEISPGTEVIRLDLFQEIQIQE
jgi:L-ascorbate metabolism protein UlaG (beta-lactamase superfamily)